MRIWKRPVEILHVEDSKLDAQLAQLALNDFSVENRVHHVLNGDKAMAFLRQQGEFAKAPRPDLILLDLNLPIKHGSEVLAEIRGDPQLKPMVVVVLTSSEAEEDIRECYRLNCNAYLTKPLDMGELMEAFRAVERLFLQVSKLPTDA